MDRSDIDYIARYHVGDFRVVVFRDDGFWERCVEHLLEAGVAVPLSHRAEWVLAGLSTADRYLAVLDGNGHCVCGLPVSPISTLSVPGHRVLRADRLGKGTSIRASRAAVRGLQRLADEQHRVLELETEVFSRDTEVRQGIGQELADAGFAQAEDRRMYSHTVQVDLGRDEEEIFMSLHSTCRQNIRDPGKNGLEIRPIEDPAYGPRVEEILEEVFERTGAEAPSHDWKQRIEFASDHPDLYRIAGTFTPDRDGIDSLLAFASGGHHGDHAVYADGGATRDFGDNVSLTYAPVWDLIQWANRTDADWFDMGGIPVRTRPDTLKGIADFKRYFSKDVVRVRDEWRYRPNPVRSWTSRRVRSAADWARGILGSTAAAN